MKWRHAVRMDLRACEDLLQVSVRVRRAKFRTERAVWRPKTGLCLSFRERGIQREHETAGKRSRGRSDTLQKPSINMPLKRTLVLLAFSIP